MRKLFYNAIIHRMNADDDFASAMLVENGTLREVYNVDPLHISDCEKIDLAGHYVFPGFIDTHTHCFEGGLYAQSLDLSKALDISQVLQKISDYYQQAKTSGTEQLDAFRYDENNIAEKRFPTRAELDSVCPNLSLVLRRIDGHSSVINSFALKQFNRGNSTWLREFSGIQLKDEVLRGFVNDKVVHWFHSNCSEETVFQAYKIASDLALANGITTVHTMVGDAQNSLMHYGWLKENLSRFGVNYILYPQSFNLTAALDVGASRIGGCILADGSLGSYTAALRQPYSIADYTLGTLCHDDDFWNQFIGKATAAGLQVAVHCIGDRAIQQINNAYLKTYNKHPHDLRHELIHCEMTPNDLMDEIIKSKAVPVMQPAFDKYWGGNQGYYQRVLGTDRANQMNRFNTFYQRGVPITGGSDWYITELDALHGIRAAVFHKNPEERITPLQSIKMYTINAAWLSHDENRLGQLSVGFEADFVILDTNPLTTEGLNTVGVIATYKQGKLVYNT
jgi:predicted amidohydrolase YtcJ